MGSLLKNPVGHDNAEIPPPYPLRSRRILDVLQINGGGSSSDPQPFLIRG